MDEDFDELFGEENQYYMETSAFPNHSPLTWEYLVARREFNGQKGSNNKGNRNFKGNDSKKEKFEEFIQLQSRLDDGDFSKIMERMENLLGEKESDSIYSLNEQLYESYSQTQTKSPLYPKEKKAHWDFFEMLRNEDTKDLSHHSLKLEEIIHYANSTKKLENSEFDFFIPEDLLLDHLSILAIVQKKESFSVIKRHLETSVFSI